jgi:uncharacterized protein (DUF488 family)
VKLLEQYGIKTLVDVRSFPSSKIAPQFNRDELTSALEAAGIGYLWTGSTMGGRGRETYEKIRQKSNFQEAMRELIRTSQEQPTALMCAEEDPFTCHRRFLISRSLFEDFAFLNVQHIRKDGSVQEEPGFPDTAIQMGLGF